MEYSPCCVNFTTLIKAQRRKRRKVIAHIHERIRFRRNNFAHQLSHKLVTLYGAIYFEQLNVGGMVRNHRLAKSISDAAWDQLIRFTSYKAAEAGRLCGRVDARGTSQECSACGTIVQKGLSQRVYDCSCGLVLGRDHNAAINILARGLAGVSLRAKEAASF